MDSVKRKKEFKEAVRKPESRDDSRFGHRKPFPNENEKPSIFVYKNPGRHWWGTR